MTSTIARFSILGSLAMAAACGGAAHPAAPQAVAPMSLAADEAMLSIPAGKYIAGSTPEERAAAYDDYQAATTQDVARANGWFDHEEDRHMLELPAFRIDLMPVTQAQFAEFVAAGKASPLTIDEATWAAQGFSQDFASQVLRFTWKGGSPPSERMDHPVVLVTWSEAEQYCAWRGQLAGHPRRLPTAAEFEKASRGEGGMTYPWGNTFERAKLNTADGGPLDTTPVGTYVAGASPYGVLDLAGNVFQWTSTSGTEPSTKLVKGSAWDDHAGVGRGASSHARKVTARHVIVGFRCAGPA